MPESLFHSTNSIDEFMNVLTHSSKKFALRSPVISWHFRLDDVYIDEFYDIGISKTKVIERVHYFSYLLKAVGFASGYLRLIDAITLKDVTPEPFTYGRGPITHVDFSPKGDYCAYAVSVVK